MRGGKQTPVCPRTVHSSTVRQNLKMNARYITNKEIEKLRVDRIPEVNSSLGTILKTNNNIFIYGERGIGKTFLLKSIYNETLTESDNIFPFFLNLFSLSRNSFINNEYAFSSFLALEIITSIWTELYNRPHSELIEKSINPDFGDNSLKRKINYLQKTYANLAASARKIQSTEEGNIGVKAILNGGLKISESESREFSQLMPFEIISYIEELQEFLLKKEKKIKLVALCDEANLMSKEWQRALLSKHLDIFSNINIQFVFVAGISYEQMDINIPNTFEFILSVDGLQKEYINELITKHHPEYEISISNENLEHLHKSTNGNPRSILSIAENVIRNDFKNNKLEINKSHINFFIKQRKKWTKNFA